MWLANNALARALASAPRRVGLFEIRGESENAGALVDCRAAYKIIYCMSFPFATPAASSLANCLRVAVAVPQTFLHMLSCRASSGSEKLQCCPMLCELRSKCLQGDVQVDKGVGGMCFDILVSLIQLLHTLLHTAI